jgi:spermidine synthase
VFATGLDALLGIAMLWMDRRYHSNASPNVVAIAKETEPTVLAAGGDANLHATKYPMLPTKASGSGSWGPLILAFISGMVVLALEVLAVQMLMLVATLSLYGPAAILFSLLSCLAASAMIVPYIVGSRSRSDHVTSTIRRMLMISGICVILAPLVFYGIARYSNWFASNDSVVGFMFKLIAMTLLTLGPAWLVSGTLFPLVMVWNGCDVPARESGKRLGWLLAVNGIGGLIGAELTLRWLLPAFGIYGGLVVIACLMMAVAWLSIIITPQPTQAYRHVIAAMSMLFAVGVGFTAIASIPTTNIRPGTKLIRSAIGQEGVVAVVGDDRGNRSIIMSNQYSLGGTSVRFDQERQVLLPLLLHPDPRHIGCIGLATGITAGAAVTVNEVESVTAIELSPLVIEAADRDFSEFNQGITKSSKASIVNEDGRTYIASTLDRFDVVAGDLFLPWAPGESRLYSIEHFQAVRRSLKEGGVFCQWLAMNQLTRLQMESIAKSFQQVFPDTVLFMNHFRGDSAMLALVGWNSPEGAGVQWKLVEDRCRILREESQIVDPILRSVDGLVMLYLGRWDSTRSTAPIITLDDPSLEISAATERLTGRPSSKYFIRASWIEFCRERRRETLLQSDPFVSSQSKLLELAGGLQEFDHALVTRDKIAGTIAVQIQKQMSTSISEDVTADWSRWPASSYAWRKL